MGLSDLPTLADDPRRVRQKREEPSRVETARAQETADEANWREVCRQVNLRDGYRCRACGRGCDPSALSLLKKAHHHHVVYRSAGGEDVTKNVCVLCADCHDQEHTKRTLHVEGNADEAPWLTLYKRDPVTRELYVWQQETGLRVYERD